MRIRLSEQLDSPCNNIHILIHVPLDPQLGGWVVIAMLLGDDGDDGVSANWEVGNMYKSHLWKVHCFKDRT